MTRRIHRCRLVCIIANLRSDDTQSVETRKANFQQVRRLRLTALRPPPHRQTFFMRDKVCHLGDKLCDAIQGTMKNLEPPNYCDPNFRFLLSAFPLPSTDG